MKQILSFRLAKKEDCQTVYEIRNNNEIRKNLLDSEPIKKVDHEKFWKNIYLNDDMYKIYLAILAGGRVVGYCDIKENPNAIELGFKILSKFQRMGFGLQCMKFLLNETEDSVKSGKYRFLTVLEGNDRAIKFYEKYGFVYFNERVVLHKGKQKSLYVMVRR